MTFFDNGAADWEKTENETRGMWLTLDYANMSVTLDKAYVAPESYSSVSQGSVQPLANGNVFMGYGSNPAFIEYTHDGEAVWDVQFGIIGNATVQSYRAYKQDWAAYPSWNPSIAATGNGTDNTTVYMSWNGATEIKTWAVLSSDSSSQLFNTTDLWRNVTKAGFETNVTVGTGHRYVRAAALTAEGKVLGATDVVDVRDGSLTPLDKGVDIGTGNANTTSTSSASPDSSPAASSSSPSTVSKKSAAAVGFEAPAAFALGAASLALVFFGL